MEQKRPVRKWLWVFTLIAALIVFYKVAEKPAIVLESVSWVAGILAPFIGGFVIAFLLHGPSRWLEKQILRLKGKAWPKLARPLSLTAVYLLLLGLLTLLFYLILPQLAASLTGLVKALPGYIDLAQERLEDFTRPGGLLDRFNLGEKLDEIYATLKEFATRILTTENILTALKSLVDVTTSIVDVVIAFMVSIYMLSGRETLVRHCKSLLHLVLRPAAVNALSGYAHKISGIFYRYLYGSFIDALVVGITASIGLAIFGVPYAVLLGMTMGLLNMIPYFGALIGFVINVLITLLTKNIYTALAVAIYLLVIQQVDANILQPRVVGGSVGIRPIYVLLGITLFGGLFGFWGIFLGVPLMAVIQLLVKDAIARKKQAAEIATEAAPAEATAEADQPPAPKDK